MDEITTIMENIIDMVVWPVFAGIIVIMTMYTGFLFLASSGDPSRLAKAKTAFLWTIIGIGVGILAFSAYDIIKGVIGVIGN